MQAQFQQQMQQVMTPQQWQAWTQMTGEPFNFPPTAFFPHDNNVRVAGQQSIRRGTGSQNGIQNDNDAARDGNVGVTRGTPLDTQNRPVTGSQNGNQSGTQNNNDAAQDGNVGATQGTPFDSPQ